MLLMLKVATFTQALSGQLGAGALVSTSGGAPLLSRFVRQGGDVDLPILGTERQKPSGLVSIAPPTKLPCHYALGPKEIPGSALPPFRYVQLLCSRAPIGFAARSRPI